MYDIEINGTSYPVKFGMNFIREMNQRVTVSMDAWGGKEENVGLNYYIAKSANDEVQATSFYEYLKAPQSLRLK